MTALITFLSRARKLILLAVALTVVLTLVAAQTGSHTAAPVAQASGVVEGLLASAPVLNYQGRLLDPATGNPKPNGTYLMVFCLYDVETRGSPLWTETKNVTVSGGLFNTLLGDTTSLNLAVFDGRSLWLGVTVGADPEATPRMPVSYAPYALYAGNAGKLGGEPPDAFAFREHTHDATNIISGLLPNARFSAYDDLATESKIGAGNNQVAAGSHLHDDRYYTQTDSDARFVNAGGDTMTGVLTVPRIVYSTPRTQYFMIGSEGFVPGSNVDYTNTYGVGGAYLYSGSGALVAPVHLPQGAVVTGFRVFFYDNSTGDLDVKWARQTMTSGGYSFLAEVSSAGISGYGNRSTTSIGGNPIDNTSFSYHVYAYSTAWDSSLKIKGALITYTIGEVP